MGFGRGEAGLQEFPRMTFPLPCFTKFFGITLESPIRFDGSEMKILSASKPVLPGNGVSSSARICARGGNPILRIVNNDGWRRECAPGGLDFHPVASRFQIRNCLLANS